MIKNEKQLYDKQSLAINDTWKYKYNEHLKKRKDNEISNKEFNKIQVVDKIDKENYNKQLNRQDSENHINYCLNNDFYTENTETCKNTIFPHRYLKYHWKGMNKTERNKILLEQDKILQDKKNQDSLDKQKDKLWAKQQEHIRLNNIKQKMMMDRQKYKMVKDEYIEFNKLNSIK